MSWRGRLAANMHELVFLLSPCEKSAAARSFIKKNVGELQRLNPTFGLKVRSLNSTDPVMVARYDFDQAKYYFLTGASEKDIELALKDFVENGKPFNRVLDDQLILSQAVIRGDVEYPAEITSSGAEEIQNT